MFTDILPWEDASSAITGSSDAVRDLGRTTEQFGQLDRLLTEEQEAPLEGETMTKITARAVQIVDAAGEAGGIDEVRRLAERGWPADRELEGDSPELREEIRRVAAHALSDG